MIGILCDSACDLPSIYLKKNFLEIAPLQVILNDKSYRDVVEITTPEVIEFMKKDIPKTSLPSYKDIEEKLNKLVEKGFKKIIALTISSNLSGTHNMFRNVINDFLKTNKDIEIELIDTLSISIGSGLILKKAMDMIEDNKSFEEIKNKLNSIIPNKSRVYYTIPTLKFLKAGGRIGKVSATIGDFLNIKPVISVNTDGIYYTVAKGRGMKKSINKMFEVFKEFVSEKTVESAAVYVSSSDALTTKLKNELIEKVKSIGINNIIEGTITSAMLVHTGEGLVGMSVIAN
ncbi:hypothetical protein OSSY52_10910 [Tepiditoga spiralis]|uniref:DegV family protein n=1 Tax=Tepiditoga spiralis TaxID=2108365 RepID=A0A7G1G3G4_9BACT|nr:DegV family protein [Tepiditoga spiralis]BBE30950.1 hypothetical protein OSSY52_10910 [Tepiditoga spiralis]